MTSTAAYKPLADDQIKVLTAQICTAEAWQTILVSDSFDAARVCQCHFAGKVRIGSLTGQVSSATGRDKPAGLYNATIIDCDIADNVRIANVAVHLASYNISQGACIEDVSVMETRPGAQFGNGVEIAMLNEGGGRELILFNELSAQFSYLMCLHRYRPKLIEQLTAIAQQAAASARADRGCIAAGVRICGAKRIIDVQIGQGALITGAAALVNGTILSSNEAPAYVGDAVHAYDFIFAEGSKVDSGAIVSKSYIGQGCQIGQQFSATDSVFFANSEGFHGEACNVFAGPFTITHHKSTLLLAGLFSFYNAGSGTNQSNHLYKLGPLHEGKLERGCKTGSFAYMMWPCRVGPFSVILGKHTRTFDTSLLPFSLLEATPTGHCLVAPGRNLASVGTARDGAKWPSHDNRPSRNQRDRICFDVLSPFTVGRMLSGLQLLEDAQATYARDDETVTINGAQIKRDPLSAGQKLYRMGIETYLLEQVFQRIETWRDNAAGSLKDALAAAPDAAYSPQWIDIVGQLMPAARLAELHERIESGSVANLADLNSELDRILAAYADDQWIWVRNIYEQVFGQRLDSFDEAQIPNLAGALLARKQEFLKSILTDAAKEFSHLKRTGFGQDGDHDDAATDFKAVRGDYQNTKFVKQMNQSITDLEARIKRFK